MSAPASPRLWVGLFVLILAAAALGGCTAGNPVASTTDEDGTASSTQLLTTTTSTTGSGTRLLTGSGSTGLTAGNRVPLLNLTADVTTVGLGGQIRLTAEAMDPDGDPVTFDWTASSGSFLRRDRGSAQWVAAEQQGPAEIACTLADDHGGRTTARIQVLVVGGRQYSIRILLDRTALAAMGVTTDSTAYVPVRQAKVEIPALDLVTVTDSEGRASFDLDAATGAGLGSTPATVEVEHLDWQMSWPLKTSPGGGTLADEIRLQPGYEGVTVAHARGTSFAGQLGNLRVSAFESVVGQPRPLPDVTFEAGTQSLRAPAEGSLLAAALTGPVALSARRIGYQSQEQLPVPVAADAVTLVRLRLLATNTTPGDPATIVSLKPYPGAIDVPVLGPFEIGFAQAMDPLSLLDDLDLTFSEGDQLTTLDGAGLLARFAVSWPDARTLRLTPRLPLKPRTRYALVLTRFVARSRDGRLLRSYTGLHGAFTTADDRTPQLLGTSPRAGEVGVGRSGPFQLRFDQPMDPASLLVNTRIEVSNLDNGSTVSFDQLSLGSWFNVAWSESNSLLTLTPRSPLKANTPYRVRLLVTALTSITGKRLLGADALIGHFVTGSL